MKLLPSYDATETRLTCFRPSSTIGARLAKGEVMRSRLYLAVFALALGTCLWGQATSQIQGVVLDPAGAAIPSAEVKATQTDTGLVRTATSSEDGTYVLTNLPIGPYRLDVTKAGFSSYSQTGIVLQVATNPTVNV